jgi:protein-disulfide isomerase
MLSFSSRAKNTIEILSHVAVIAAAAVVVWRLGFQPNTASATTPLIEDVTGQSLGAAQLSHVFGSGSIAIVEFSDFQCPFCAQHARELPALTRELIDTGKARYFVVNRPLDMHREAVLAAEAAECAGKQGQFWEMHDLLFAKQEDLPTRDYLTWAAALNLNGELFDRCLREHSTLAKVNDDIDVAKSLRIEGTPTFFIGQMRDDGGVTLRTRLNGVATVQSIVAEVAKLKQ